MPTPFRRIGVTMRDAFPEKEHVLGELSRIVKSAGADLSSETKGCDLLIVLGGDGTTLRAVRELQDFRTPLLAINHGHVGFLAECETGEMDKVLPGLLLGESMLEERILLQCEVTREGRQIFSGIALNEVVVSQGPIARLIELKTSIGGKPLTAFRADGLIVATPTGSTAYSLSAGGPILHPTLNVLLLTPINVYAFSQKPLVIPATEDILVEILQHESTIGDCDISLTLDGQVHARLTQKDRIMVKKHPEHVRFLRRRDRTFYDKLRKKLGWET